MIRAEATACSISAPFQARVAEDRRMRSIGLGVDPVALHVNGEDLFALLFVRQIDEEDLVEATLAEDLRRQQVDAIGGGGDEDVRPVLLHPGQKSGEDPGVGTGLAIGVAGDAHLDLVDPEDRGRHRLDGLQGSVKDPFRRPVDAREDEVHVEAEERQRPLSGDDLDGEALAASGDAHEQDAARRRHVFLARFGEKEGAAFADPLFELVEPAELGDGLIRRDELEDALLARDLLFLGQNLLEEGLVERLVLVEEPTQKVFAFGERHPLERGNQPVDVAALDAARREGGADQVFDLRCRRGRAR